MKRREAMSVGDIIDKAIAATGNRAEYDRQQACYMWGEVVGPAFNARTANRWIQGDVLHVTMDSAVIKAELSMQKEALTAAINRALGKNVISSVVIH